ncbi:hypothetical protein Cantr_08678 [Candida viswanathii]|uniref:Spindle pole body component Bbp1 C-terminal domain-containing protein n=1 Tax=Candida viswanathii TaxID=5486 RepID=A0A367Y4B0_9ASCO|nr:hypothetical protein Cantr_08678 [Candida viswanathii]
MWKYLFGLDDDDSKLVNQPTIDYNVTSTRTARRNNNNNTNNPRATNHRTYGTVIDYTSEDEDDDELDLDIRYNTNMIHEWTINNNNNNNNPPTNTLPQEYPGKFPRRPQSAPTTTVKGERDLARNYKIERKIESLQREIDAEIQSDRNSNMVQNINSLHSRILQQTSILNNLSDLVEMYLDNEEMLSGEDEKYKALKKEYLAELNRVLILQEAYFLLFNRYMELKRLNKRSNRSSSGGSGVSLKEKVKLIKSKTTDVGIKNICDNVIGEVKKLEQDFENQKKELVEKHDLEVEVLKKRIQELERDK